MGIEFKPQNKNQNNSITGAAAPLILGLQPSALVDHAARVDCSLLSRIPGEPGGSFPVFSHPSLTLLCVVYDANY